MIRAWARRRWIAFRRRRLLAAYAREFRIRHGKGPGFTSTMYAYERGESEGVLKIVDGEVVWKWPESDDAV